MNWQEWNQPSAKASAQPLLPSRREEDWRYVSLKWLESWDFSRAQKGTAESESALAGFAELHFVNGELVSADPSIPLEKIQKSKAPSESFQKWFEQIEKKKSLLKASVDLFEELNRLRFQEGYFLDLPPEFSLPKPLLIRWSDDQQKGTRYPRVWIRLGTRAKLTLLEIFEGASSETQLNLPVSEIEIGDSAHLEVSRVVKSSPSSAQIGRTRIFQNKSSHLESLSVALGARLVRHNLDLYLVGAEATSRLHGLSYTGGEQVVDHHTLIDHTVGHCKTEQLYKSALHGSSRSVFNGRVSIRHAAQKADSNQLNQNLLLDSRAEADSKPQLEIWADDVKATHGSTVGQMNEEEIFYFQSRAISRSQAESMIRRGFTLDLLMQVSNPLIKSWLLSLQDEADQRLSV